MPADPFAAKRQQMRDEFFAKLFLLGGWLGGTDTYKRTMWAAVPDAALAHAGYTLTFRKGLPEQGADNRLVMAGHEAMLAQWFHRPLNRSDIELSRQWFTHHAATKAFPNELWDAVLAAQPPGEHATLPIDILGFPGGQTFLAGVPCLTFEGSGGVTSYLEPAMCRYFAPVIQATKARLMRQVTPRDAEFGLRSAPVEINNLILLLARYVGGSNGEPQLTSNDTAEFLWPEMFRSVGTIGHEMMCAAQSFDRSLADAEYEMMDRFVSRMGTASLLCDLVEARPPRHRVGRVQADRDGRPAEHQVLELARQGDAARLPPRLRPRRHAGRRRRLRDHRRRTAVREIGRARPRGVPRAVRRASRAGRPHLEPVHEVGAVAARRRVPAAVPRDAGGRDRGGPRPTWYDGCGGNAMTSAYVVTGTLTDGKTVQLDEPLPVTAGKVRITVEVMEPSRPTQSLHEWLEELRARQAARGHVPRTVKEVEAYLKAERDSWED